MSAPRKFSEKIAIQKQKAAEQEEAFASIMREVSTARHQPIPTHNNNLRHGLNGLPSNNIMYKGGSLPAFPTPHLEVQSPVVNDLSNTFPGRAVYDDQNYRSRANHQGRVLHRPKARADTSPYHLPYQTLQEAGIWRRTFSDPSMGPMSRGSPSPKISPKEPKSPQPVVKSPDVNKAFGSPVMHDRSHHHMKVQSNSGSLPDVAGLCIDIPNQEREDNMMKNQRSSNVKFTVPTALPIRRQMNINTNKQVFPRQFSNPDHKEQQRFLINQLSQELQGSSLNSPTSPGAVPPFGSISPLAFEAVYPSNAMTNLPPNLNTGIFEQEQYLNLIRMNELMYEQSNKQLPPRYEDSQQQQRRQQQQQHQQQRQQQQQQQHQPPQHQINSLQEHVPAKLANLDNLRSLGQTLPGNEFANQFRLGITGNEEPPKEDISDEILNNIRIGLDPLNFEDYQLLANSNIEVADQSVEDQFRQDRINFP